MPLCSGLECGSDYTGTLSTTENGKTCQLWSLSDAPSTAHLGKHNFCRNPAENPGDRPWCYTTDPNTRWEYCNTPGCCQDRTTKGRDYTGTVSTTEKGKTCRKWSVPVAPPHGQFATTVQWQKWQHNYCRNPSHATTGEPGCAFWWRLETLKSSRDICRLFVYTFGNFSWPQGEECGATPPTLAPPGTTAGCPSARLDDNTRQLKATTWTSITDKTYEL